MKAIAVHSGRPGASVYDRTVTVADEGRALDRAPATMDAVA